MNQNTISKPEPVVMTIERAGMIFNEHRLHRCIGEITGMVWVDDFETWLAFNRHVICVDRFSA